MQAGDIIAEGEEGAVGVEGSSNDSSQGAKVIKPQEIASVEVVEVEGLDGRAVVLPGLLQVDGCTAAIAAVYVIVCSTCTMDSAIVNRFHQCPRFCQQRVQAVVLHGSTYCVG
jgi:hypothetical protein